MKFNKLAGLGIASIVLFGSVGQLAISASPAQAQRVRVAAKSTSLIASGNFVNQEKRTTGKAKIVNINGRRYLEFDRRFSTGNGPDVKIILHKNSSIPLNIKEGNYITLSRIKSFNGKQRYAIPNNINLANYKSVGIWCEEFNATFGFASLRGA
ncbi:MAG: DM13 domain-containing protein [Rivularia sp. (in: Bacteria)]|nr:DM13 domain-containing protein [Rivularia sp. MS3]